MSEPRLRTLEELDRALEQSKSRPLLLFKHSLTCEISVAVYAEYQKYISSLPETPGFETAVVEIQNARPISTEIAARTGVKHESPQALLVSDGRVVWHASHWGITEKSLRMAVENLASKQ